LSRKFRAALFASRILRYRWAWPQQLSGRADPRGSAGLHHRECGFLLIGLEASQSIELRAAIGDRWECSDPITQLWLDLPGPGDVFADRPLSQADLGPDIGGEGCNGGERRCMAHGFNQRDRLGDRLIHWPS